MLLETSEIKIALLGNVSAGKTTVLNALFKDKYGEVSMKRTTAGVNYFRISVKPPASSKKENEDDENEEGTGTVEEELPWFPNADKTRCAVSTLKEITTDNRNLRDSNRVHEKWFDVELEENLVAMRKGTQLVVVDIPGLNEAGACNKYKEYVVQKWDTFDCVVLVMDGKQGVNTEDQVDLLDLAKENRKRRPEVPIIVLFNKVDDPEDAEQQDFVREAKEEVERIFLSDEETNNSSPHDSGFGAPVSSAPTWGFGSSQAPEAWRYLGTKHAEYQATTRQDGTMVTITAMPQYDSKCLEELRCEDYMTGLQSFGQAPAPARGGFVSGSTNPVSFSFGGGARASAPSTGFPFGGFATAPAPSADAASSSFGAPAQPAHSGGGFSFGGSATAPSADAASSPFGAPAQPAPSGGGFSFGGSVTAPAPSASASASAGASTRGFSFGAPAPAVGFAFGSDPAPSAMNTPFGVSSRQATPSFSLGSISVLQDAGESDEPGRTSENKTPASSPAPSIHAASPTSTGKQNESMSTTYVVAAARGRTFFIPVSAMHAFIHQSASTMDFQSFQHYFDKDLVEKVGRFQLGQRLWNKLTEEERLKETHKILVDPSVHSEALADSNFESFGNVLKEQLGGDAAQLQLMEGQIKASIRDLEDSYSAANTHNVEQKVLISNLIESAYVKTEAHLGLQQAKAVVPDLVSSFWACYDKLEDKAFAEFEKGGPFTVSILAAAMDELIACHQLCRRIALEPLGRAIILRMKDLFRRQLEVLVINLSGTVFLQSYQSSVAWNLTAIQKYQIWGSIALMSSISKHFCLSFGREKIMIIDIQCAKWQSEWLEAASSSPHAPGFVSRLDQSVVLPHSPAYSNHNGHIAFRYCEYMESLDAAMAGQIKLETAGAVGNRGNACEPGETKNP